MKAVILALSFALVLAGMTPMTAEARRFGGGGFSGMQRSTTPRTPPPAAPAKPAQAAPTTPATAGAAAAAAPRRSWMGPIAGLAAGLGLAALMSHLGLGAEFANMIMMVLLAVVAFVAIRFLMNRFGRGGAPGRLAGAGAGAGAGTGAGLNAGGAMPFQKTVQPSLSSTSPWAPVAAAAAGGGAALASNDDAATASHAVPLPEGFDTDGFSRVAKMIFIRMQAANDSGDLNDLRHFTTPEMFAAVRLDLQERASVPQTTDVVSIDADVLEVAMEAERQLVSVRFHGLIREETDAAAAPFDEVWHLVKPVDGSREWAIAGIQQAA